MTIKNKAEKVTDYAAEKLPARAGLDLAMLVAPMRLMAGNTNKKMSAQQILFFFLVAEKAASGHSVHVAGLLSEYGELGRSVEKTLPNFLEPNARFPNALNWLRQVDDPTDRRVRWLELTDDGLDFVGRLVAALRQR